ncbi:MAG: ATP-binding cassette domain-containing protein [Chloroflexi bacterium]|nr:ATP-binding cassette domain-containing protein [Chloroflexota bacterium]
MAPQTRSLAISARGISKQYTRGQAGGWSVHGGLRGAVKALLGRAAPKKAREPDTFWALDDITFDIARGERVGIVGRNGAGKSTLLKVLSRVVFPTSGEAEIRGRLTSLLEVGTGFNENLTGRENVYLNASIHGLTRAEIDARFDEIVDFAGVRPFLDTPVKRYSSGMQMRLAFAVAAHLDPDILLLDEVLAVGDLSFQQKCLERVEGLVNEGRTLVFVSHSLDAITRFCDRCLWIDGGKLRMDGRSEQVVEVYLEELAGIRSSRDWSSGLGLPLSGLGRAPAATDSRPGDDDVRLVGARIIGTDGDERSSVPVDEPFGIEVTFDILREGNNIQPALHFKGQTDQILFVVAYTDAEWLERPPPVGRHVATAWVPAHLLNVGIIYVTVVLQTPDPFQTHCAVERAVSLNVFERFGAEGTARGLYAREFPGAVRPRLAWDTHRSVPIEDTAASAPAAEPVTP